MRIDKHINDVNWREIKDILHQITEIKSLSLNFMRLTEFPKMSHITIKYDFNCSHNQIASFKNCPKINGNFNCTFNEIKSFKDCPEIGGYFKCYGNKFTSFKDCPQINGVFIIDFDVFDKVLDCSKEKKISLLEAQVELYNKQDKNILDNIDKFPDLVAYIRLKELNKLLEIDN